MFTLDTSGINKKINAVKAEAYGQLNSSVSQLAQDSADEMRTIIKTKGTAFSRFRQSLGLGSNGRVRTGHMLDSVGFEIERNDTGMTIKVGYTKDQQPYFIYQETGFQNIWRFASFGKGTSGPNAPQGFAFVKGTGRWTEGIFAMRDTTRSIEANKAKVGIQVKNSIKKKFAGA